MRKLGNKDEPSSHTSQPPIDPPEVPSPEIEADALISWGTPTEMPLDVFLEICSNIHGSHLARLSAHAEIVVLPQQLVEQLARKAGMSSDRPSVIWMLNRLLLEKG
jgi:hypothetical protein